MGGSSSILSEKHVVIVGGGYGGTTLANLLKGKCKFTLIDPKDSFHHTVGTLRAAVEKGFAKKIFIPYAPSYGESFKQGTVVKIDPSGKKVALESGEEIVYDYLVIATGTSVSPGAFPVKLDPSVKNTSEAMELFNGYIDKISAAKDIVIIGGGPVGVELAGEIATDFTEKKITLIHSKSALIDNGVFIDKFKKQLLEAMQKKGVEVLLEHKVTNLDDLPKDGSSRCSVQTDKGSAVEADIVFVCIGMKTNSSAYSQAFSDKMDEIGCLKVDEFCRVEGCTDVFAIGDCSTADASAKMAFKAGCQAEVVAKNLQLQEEGKALNPYKLSFNAMFVPLGRDGGISQFNTMVLGNFATKMAKSKDLFVSKYWKDMGQTVPK